MSYFNFILKSIIISLFIIIATEQSFAQSLRVLKPTSTFSLDSIKINGYTCNWNNYKFFNKYKIGFSEEDCINDSTLNNWYSEEEFKKIEDTAKMYYVAQEITIPRNLFNKPIFRGIFVDVEKIWQNGELVYDFTFSDNKKFFETVNDGQFPFSFSKEKNIVVYKVKSKKDKGVVNFIISFMFNSYFGYINFIQTDHDINITLSTLSSFLFAVSLMLFFIYLFGIREKKYLWGTAFALTLTLCLFSFTGFIKIFETEGIGIFFFLISPYFLVQFIYSLNNNQLPKLVNKTLLILSTFLTCFIIAFILEIQFINDIFKIDKNALTILIPTTLLFIISSTFVFVGIFKAIKQKLNNAWILFAGLLLIVALTIFWLGTSVGESTFIENIVDTNLYTVFQILPMPLAVLIAIIRDYVASSKNLKSQLVKVEELTAQTIKEQEEKQQILTSQNEKLEQQVTERTQEINNQKHLLQEKNKEITDSINYAKRLQQAILPPMEFISKNFPDSFVLYKPKDIVAGDFYWAEQTNDLFFIVAADCTGHGVPGAMVSVVCSNALNRTVKEFSLTDTGKILDKTRELVIETFEKSNTEIKDGMDISLICIDKQNEKIFWSGANNALWYVQDNILTEIKADKQPVGKSDDNKPFTTHSIDYKNNTTFYLFTDGFADQFGGPKGKKFKYKQFEETLVSINNKPMKEQLVIIEQKFEEWKGALEQVDDVCVIGIKI